MDDMLPEPRLNEIIASLERSRRQIEAGQTIDGETVLAEIRAQIAAYEATHLEVGVTTAKA